MSLLLAARRQAVRSSVWRCTSSSSSATPVDDVSTIYVHHVSKTVLQHLQKNQHDWLVSTGLDQGLRLNANGTFVLQFPVSHLGVDGGRIWTSYDIANKQHWLSVYRRKLKARFLLKDSSHTNANVIQSHIRSTVNEMIELLSRK